MRLGTEILDEIFRVIEDRRDRPRGGSYVSALLAKGGACDKVDEEARELVEAARDGERKDIIHEAADLIFHTMVLLADKKVKLDEVMEELRRRRR